MKETTKCYCGHTTYCDCSPLEQPKQETPKQHVELINDNIEEFDKAIKLFKQETLEGSADKWVFETNGHKWSNNDDTAGDNYGSFIAGYKLAKERSYSEEDIKEAFRVGFNVGYNYETSPSYLTFEQWFEQFKKK